MTRIPKQLVPLIKGNYWLAFAWLTMAVGQCRLDRGPDDYISPMLRLAVNLAERMHV